jgi:hypothetical protein
MLQNIFQSLLQPLHQLLHDIIAAKKGRSLQ